jgi:hypothetical protein
MSRRVADGSPTVRGVTAFYLIITREPTAEGGLDALGGRRGGRSR